MKITWLNDSLTEARVTKGVLWWKRVATLRQVGFSLWRYVPSEDDADPHLSEELSMAAISSKVRKNEQESERRNWQPASSLPTAKAVRR